ncbi:response regulator [Pseudoalteromonas elyakovii]|nr:response regulator [Pseudoalteromonas elyakovii]
MLSILHELQFSDIHLYKSVDVAWSKLKQTEPDLIICDWYPDKKDALSLLKKVRAKDDGSYILFVIVSGILEHELVELAVSMGVDEYVVKPFNIKILEDKVKNPPSNEGGFALAP